MAFYGLDNLDERIAAHVTAPTGTFVELGAFDGVTQSNTLHFEEKGWRGVLIEPVPGPYAACCRNRPLARVFQCACVPHGFPGETVELIDVGLMTIVDGWIAEPERQEAWVARGEQVQHLQRQLVRVPARTLDSVLDEARLSAIDLLVLDVEGGELQVLQGLDLRRHRPRHIVCEDAYTNEVRAHLLAAGYREHSILLERRFTRDVLYVDTLPHPPPGRP